MTAEEKGQDVATQEQSSQSAVELNGLFLFKEGMTTWFDQEKGQAFAVTVLRYEPQFVVQVREYSGDLGVQVAVGRKKRKLALASELGHLKRAHLENPPKVLKELRVPNSGENPAPGAIVTIDSLKVGDVVSVIGKSKGKGFAGSVKRFGFGGGPASHGSAFHRQPGSSGNRTWPGRVMPGKRFPGHLGNKTTHVKNLQVVAIDKDNQLVVVKGAVPGARNSLVTVLRSEV